MFYAMKVWLIASCLTTASAYADLVAQDAEGRITSFSAARQELTYAPVDLIPADGALLAETGPDQIWLELPPPDMPETSPPAPRERALRGVPVWLLYLSGAWCVLYVFWRHRCRTRG